MKHLTSKRRSWGLLASVATLATLAAPACRGDKSDQPPVHLQQNMLAQRRFEAQEANAFFADRRAMRPQPAHTIAVGELHQDPMLYRGIIDGKPAKRIPYRLDHAFVDRGRDRYGIYCSRCHGLAGDGRGILRTRDITVKPASHLTPRLRHEPVGYFFRTLTFGLRAMPAFARLIPLKDRWAIATYVRALQIASAAPFSFIPKAIAKKHGWHPPEAGR
ncbi:MAG: cytochrome c [Deltaproteobacteria bacterium]|nr:cytochrome c [Deltaproteobacteria bacterium]